MSTFTVISVLRAVASAIACLVVTSIISAFDSVGGSGCIQVRGFVGRVSDEILDRIETLY